MWLLGVIAQRRNIAIDEAFVVLKELALANGVSLDDVAHRVTMRIDSFE